MKGATTGIATFVIFFRFSKVRVLLFNVSFVPLSPLVSSWSLLELFFSVFVFSSLEPFLSELSFSFFSAVPCADISLAAEAACFALSAKLTARFIKGTQSLAPAFGFA